MWKKYYNKLVDAAIDENISRFDDELNAILRDVDRLQNLSETELTCQPRDTRTAIFALVTEVSARVLGMRSYRVQILAALVLSDGNLVEMQTGEGKTLVAAMVAIERALTGHACHILTFNDYLAGRDARWMRPLFQFFGVSLGYVSKRSTWRNANRPINVR